MHGNATSFQSPSGIGAVLERLKASYPSAALALRYSNPWELLAAVMLSAQCTDVMVNRVTGNLFRKYPRLEDYVRADEAEFAGDIRSTGFFNAKARHILAAAGLIQRRHGGQVPDTMAGLVEIPGVARKTANIVLSNAYGRTEGIAVDTHVSRISQRLRLLDLSTIGGRTRITFVRNGSIVPDYIRDADPVKIEQQLMQVVPQADWSAVTYRIIDHGRIACKAQHPKCGICPLVDLCPVRRE